MRDMTASDFHRIALSMEGAQEGSRMGSVDFRVGGRIFATLASVKQGYGNLKLTPEMQAEFVAELPNVFIPIHGGWGRMGMTHVRLSEVTEDVLAGSIRAAYDLRVRQNKKKMKKKQSVVRLLRSPFVSGVVPDWNRHARFAFVQA